MSDSSSSKDTSTTTTDKPPITWELIGRLSNDEYMARRVEIQQFINNPKNKKRKAQHAS